MGQSGCKRRGTARNASDSPLDGTNTPIDCGDQEQQDNFSANNNGDFNNTCSAAPVFRPTTKLVSFPYATPITSHNAPPPTVSHKFASVANNTKRHFLNRKCRFPIGVSRTGIRRAERQHGRSGSKFHAPTALEREFGTFQRELRRLPIRTEHECFLCGFS